MPLRAKRVKTMSESLLGICSPEAPHGGASPGPAALALLSRPCGAEGASKRPDCRALAGQGPAFLETPVCCDRRVAAPTWSAQGAEKTSPQRVGMTHLVEKHSATEVKLLLGKRP